MEFIPIAGLPGGWDVGYQVSPTLHLLYPERPYFKRSDGRLMTPQEVAASDQGRDVFHHVKKWLDIADQRYGGAAQSKPDWRAIDKAKLAMHVTLEELGLMADDLLDTGVEGAG